MKLMECSEAMALAAALAKSEVIPVYPITPQTHIPGGLAKMINNGEFDAEMIHVESEHSALSASVGASAAGARVFTATASQGLALMHEILFIASGMRLPIVMAVANRALSAPINIWNDQQDSISARDVGWIQLYCEDSQEAHDTTLQAFKIAEKCLLPVMVCVDGYTLSHVSEPVSVANGKFIGKNKRIILDSKNPVTMGCVGGPDMYMETREELNNDLINSMKEIKEIGKEFNKEFGRSYGLVEGVNLKNAKKVFVCIGSVCGTVREFLDSHKDVGMLKIRCFRPFPFKEIVSLLKGIPEIIVIDRNISLGLEGSLFTEIKSLKNDYDLGLVKGFIAGLGGRDINFGHLEKALNDKGGFLL